MSEQEKCPECGSPASFENYYGQLTIARSDIDHLRRQLAQAKAQRDDLLAACERTVEWLGRLAVVADKHGTDERFPAFAEANRQDARNLRATAGNIAAAIAKAAPEEKDDG